MMESTVAIRRLWMFLLLLTVWTLAHCLEIEYDKTVQSTKNEEAFLKCRVVSDLTIKQVVWFKIDKGDKEQVYHYEPASSLDVAYRGYERFSRSSVDNSSLKINPTYLTDEGIYRCRVVVWDLGQDNSTERMGLSMPIEKDASMGLIVNVPPERVQLSTFTTGTNMTLTCKAEGAKPSADITWMKTTSDGSEIPLRSTAKKTLIEQNGDLSDTTGLLYYALTKHEKAARLSCVISHPQTGKIIFKNVTMVPPVVQNAVEMYLDRLGSYVTYSTIDNQHGDLENPAGLVQISADPGFEVSINSSLTLKASAPEVFPQPHFMWWTGDQAAYLGADLYIPHLIEDTEYFLLAENPVGRVLLSVPVTVLVGDPTNQVGGDETHVVDENEVSVNSAGMNGGVIAAIIIASVLVFLLIGLIVWYFTCRDPAAAIKKRNKSVTQTAESSPFVPRNTTLKRTTSTQTLEEKRPKNPPIPQAAASEDNLLSNGRRDSPTHSSTPPPEYATKERPMDRHLKEYEESASFVGDYGSRDGLDSASSAENMHSAHGGGEETQSELSIPVSTERNLRDSAV